MKILGKDFDGNAIRDAYVYGLGTGAFAFTGIALYQSMMGEPAITSIEVLAMLLAGLIGGFAGVWMSIPKVNL